MNYPVQENQTINPVTKTLDIIQQQPEHTLFFLTAGVALGLVGKFVYNIFRKCPDPETPRDQITPLNFWHDDVPENTQKVNDLLKSGKVNTQLNETMANTTLDQSSESVPETAKEVCTRLISKMDTYLSARAVFEDGAPVVDLNTKDVIKECLQGITEANLLPTELFDLTLQILPVLVSGGLIVNILKNQLREKWFHPSTANEQRLADVLSRTECLRAEKHALFRIFSTGVHLPRLLPLLNTPTRAEFKKDMQARERAVKEYNQNTTQNRGNFQGRWGN